MNVGDICSRDIVSTGRATTLREAAALMRERHVGALLVTADLGAGEQAIGMVSDRDLAIEALARGLPADTPVERVAETRLVTISPDAPVAEAVEALKASGVRRLLVATAEGGLAGIVALEDLVDALAHELDALAKATLGLAQALRSGIQREVAERAPLPEAGTRQPPLRILPTH